MGVWKRAQEYAGHIPHPLKNLHLRIKHASRVLLLDGTFVKVKGKPLCIHIAYDTGIGVVHFAIDDSENTTAYATILNMLAERGYKPRVVVSDGHWGIKSAIQDWKIPHQLCIFHLLKNLKKALEVRGELLGGNKVLYSRMKGILKTKRIEDLPERVNRLRALLPYFRTKKQKDVTKWFFNVLHESILHLSFEEEVPRTNGIIENLNGQIKARTKTMRGVKSKSSLFNLLKILFHFRDYK